MSDSHLEALRVLKRVLKVMALSDEYFQPEAALLDEINLLDTYCDAKQLRAILEELEQRGSVEKRVQSTLTPDLKKWRLTAQGKQEAEAI